MTLKRFIFINTRAADSQFPLCQSILGNECHGDDGNILFVRTTMEFLVATGVASNGVL